MTPAAPFRVLMVCTGNICRSPTAEAILRHMAEEAGLGDRLAVDSAGTMGWHTGHPPSGPAVARARRRGYDLSTLRARQAVAEDHTRFDLLLAMDRGHLSHLERLRPSGTTAECALFLDALPDQPVREVPDPYYGDDRDYDYALDLIEDGCRAWLERLRTRV
jgi:protein-tyrosine phosphatase